MRDTKVLQQVCHNACFRRSVTSFGTGWDIMGWVVLPAKRCSGLDPKAQGWARAAIRPNRGAEDHDEGRLRFYGGAASKMRLLRDKADQLAAQAREKLAASTPRSAKIAWIS